MYRLRSLVQAQFDSTLQRVRVDAIVFSSSEPSKLNNSGYAASEITCDQFLPSFGNVLVAGDKLVAEDPETVDGFCRALNKAIEYIIDGHVEEAVDMSIEKYEPTFAEKRCCCPDLKRCVRKDLMAERLHEGKRNRRVQPEKWQALIDESKEIGNIDKDLRCI